MKAISITGYRRPAVFRQLLQSLAANDLTGWHIEIQLEPSEFAGDYQAIAGELLPPASYRINVNAYRQGVRLNPFTLLDRLFTQQEAGLVLYLEEDMLLSPDVVRLANWYQAIAHEGLLCLSLMSGGCGSPGFISFPGYENLLFKTKAFNSLGFVLTRQSWQAHFSRRWLVDYPNPLNVGGWDWSVYHYVSRQPGLFCLSPVTARATHNGREGGTHIAPDWHDIGFDLPLATGAAIAPALAAGADPYDIVDIMKLPGAVARHALLWQQMIEFMVRVSGPEIPIDPAEYFDRSMTAAVARHQAGDLRGAEVLYREALIHRAGNADALRLLGGLYVQSGRDREAQATLEQALAAQPDNAEILNNMGVVARRRGDIPAAIASFQAALKLRPAYPEASGNLASALQAAGAV